MSTLVRSAKCGILASFGYAVTFALLTMLAGCSSLKSNPWAGVNSRAQLTVLNHTTDPCAVSVQAAGQSWALGEVVPGDSVTWDLPFADQKIIAWVCGLPTQLDIDGPFRWRLVAHSRMESET